MPKKTLPIFPNAAKQMEALGERLRLARRRRKISLVLSDVDGTLVTEEKVLTEEARTAVRRLLDAGIRFAVTSGRPPLGMAMLLDALHLDTPIAGFNGGLFVTPDLAILEQKTLPEDVAAKSIELNELT